MPDYLAGKRVLLYHGDETEVSETSTTYVVKKNLNIVKDSSNLLSPARLITKVEGYIDTAGETLTIGIFIDGTEQITISFTETAYTLKSGEKDISGWSDGKHSVELEMKVTAGTGYNRLFESWLK